MTVNSLLRNVQGIGNSTQGAVDILGRITGGSFWSQLRPASYRGVPFGVFGGQVQFGRRNATHEYPFRDICWVEDLGRQPKRIQINGFLVGDDAIAQRDALIRACEKAGDGELVHPTLGRLNVALLNVGATEHWEQGRVFEITFSFIEQGQRLYPETTTTTTATVTAAATVADASAAKVFVTKAVQALQYGAAVANKAAQEASAWAAVAIQAGNDSTSLLKLAVSLPGEFGRLLGQASGITIGQLVSVTAGLTVQDLIGKAAVSRQEIASSTTTLKASATNLSTTSAQPFADAAQQLAAAVLAAAPTPGDALRGLLSLAIYSPAPSGTGVFLALQSATLDLFRRSAVAAMSRAAADYSPVSSDDAVAVRALVLDRLDAEILVAGDAGDDGAFTSMRALKAAVVQDMNAKGAAVPTLSKVETGRPMPSLALAQRLYRDSTRSTELVERAAPIHPAFMPRSFQALTS